MCVCVCCCTYFTTTRDACCSIPCSTFGPDNLQITGDSTVDLVADTKCFVTHTTHAMRKMQHKRVCNHKKPSFDPQMAEIQAQALVVDLNNDGEVEILAGAPHGHVLYLQLDGLIESLICVQRFVPPNHPFFNCALC